MISGINAGGKNGLRRVLPHSRRGEPVEETLLGLGAHAPAFACCPIELEQAGQTEPVPDDTTYRREQLGEAVGPFAQEGLKAQENVKQQRGPDLPAHGVGAVAEEVGPLPGLFEENLDLPAATVKVGHGGWGPIEVVREKRHHCRLAVEFDLGGDAAYAIGALAAGVGCDEHDLIVGENRAAGLAHPLFDRSEPKVALGPGYTKHVAQEQTEQVGEVGVGAVEDHNLRRADAGSHLPGEGIVVVAGGVDDGEARQRVTLGRGLGPAMLCPVHAGSDQLDCRGIHHVDDAFKAVSENAPAGAETRLHGPQMFENALEQLLRHRGVAHLVRMRKAVAARRRCPAIAPASRSPDTWKRAKYWSARLIRKPPERLGRQAHLFIDNR